MPIGNATAQLDLRLLLALDALLRHHHLTRAGDSLGLSQPVMSTYLRRLRTVMGDPLFVVASESAARPGRRVRRGCAAVRSSDGHRLLAWHRCHDADPAHRWLRATIERVLARTPMRR